MKLITGREAVQTLFSNSDIQKYFEMDVLPLLSAAVFENGSFLTEEQRLSDYLFFVISGQLKVFNYLSNSDILTLRYLNDFHFPHGLIGETDLLWGYPAVSTVQAISQTTALAVHLPRYREILLQDKHFLTIICKKLSLNSQIAILDTVAAHNSIKTRLATLLYHNSSHGVLQGSLLEYQEMLSVSYRHLVRLMNEFCEMGILRKENKKYRIIDEKLLLSMLPDDYFKFEI